MATQRGTTTVPTTQPLKWGRCVQQYLSQHTPKGVCVLGQYFGTASQPHIWDGVWDIWDTWDTHAFGPLE